MLPESSAKGCLIHLFFTVNDVDYDDDGNENNDDDDENDDVGTLRSPRVEQNVH